MPELPEVETVCRGLRRHLLGRTITEVVVRSEAVIHMPGVDGETFARALCGKNIQAVERRGKYIILVLDGCWLVCHLRMTGKLLVRGEMKEAGKHDHVLFYLDDGCILLYEDVRRFGGFVLSETSPYLSVPLSKLGPEPLTEAFEEEGFYQSCRNRNRPIKSHLLDQGVVAGIGNIYADEILFRAGVRPRKSAARITRAEAATLVTATKVVLEEAVQAGGSTIRDYVDSDNRRGAFQLKHQVYGRAGEPCRRCGSVLKSVTVGGRSSVYCPHCQKS